MKIVKYYDELYKAELDRQLLAQEGVPAEIFNEYLNQVLPYGEFVGFIHKPYLAVPDSFYKEAVHVLGLGEASLPD